MTQDTKKKPRPAATPSEAAPRHRDIGIAAVAAAVRYQGTADNRKAASAGRETSWHAGRS
jgi:hypothetical protein